MFKPMKEHRAVVREATPADLARFYEGKPVPTLRAWLGEVGDKVIGIGGYAFQMGRWVAFFDLCEMGRKYKLTMARTARMMLREADKAGIAFLYAETNENEPGAPRWLKSLGFRQDPFVASLFRRENKINGRT